MTQTVQFREGERGDRDAILALRALAFPDDDEDKKQPGFWTWEFIDTHAGSGRFFVADAGDRIVGHFAFVPQHYVAAGQTMRGALAVDVMTHPEFRRRKVFSGLASFAAGQLRKDVQVAIAFQIREPVLAGMLAGGWLVAPRIPVLLKPLSLRSIARDFRLPVGAPSREHYERSEENLADSIRPIQQRDLVQIDALLATSGARQRRSLEFLHWRYQQNPHWRYELDGFFQGEQLRAFLIHRDAILRGLRSVAIADVGVLPGSDESLQQLVRHVCRRAKERGAGVAAALLSRHHPAYASLKRSGFISGPHRFRLLLQVFDESFHWVRHTSWSLSWGDTDHL